MLKVKMFYLVMLTLLNITAVGQYNYDPMFGFHCDDNSGIYLHPELKNSVSIGGYYKPERTNSYPGTNGNSVFRVMVVFVQFANDTIDVNNTNWDTAGPPAYMNNLLKYSRSTNSGSDWWNSYDSSNQRMSDYWMEISRGTMHMVGKGFYIKLSHPWWWYKNNGSLAQVNTEIYDSLNVKVADTWSDYDNWTYKDGTFKYEKDGQIDMMYVVHRGWRPDIGLNPGSIALLFSSTQGSRHVVSSGDTIVTGCWTSGSGCTFTPGAGFPANSPPVIYSPYGSDEFLGLVCHETGHYHFGGGHCNYGIMMGTDAIYGMDNRHSPWEAIKLGYISPTEINFNTINYTLKDFSSREANNGEVLQVPITGSGEFFLLALRNKVSSYDRIMLGDTAHGNPYREINFDYGKGLYIYHIVGGYTWAPFVDQECADGLYYWQQRDSFIPDWVNPSNPVQKIPFYIKDSVSYNNDVSNGGFANIDHKSLRSWGGYGKYNTSLYGDGTDRINTNESVPWTTRSWQGDRWDAWNVGYNEVFSPYSSPSTRIWGNDNSEIFIYYKSYVNSTANIEIYRVGSPYIETQILQLTPPSRPMGVRVDDYYPEVGWCVPKVIWNHNREPDMLRRDTTKRYRVYRATQPDMSSVPVNYVQIAEVYILKDSTPYYIDSTILRYDCALLDQNPPYGTKFPVRYEIKAFDTNGDSSVFSDFASTEGITPDGGIEDGGDHRATNENIPSKFNLQQNFPNPFNPVTNIKYDLPKDIFVKMKIYDILGREIKTLVNEFKQAGSYLVSFSGSEFASGIYFYRIQAGSFIQVKRMVLIK